MICQSKIDDCAIVSFLWYIAWGELQCSTEDYQNNSSFTVSTNDYTAFCESSYFYNLSKIRSFVQFDNKFSIDMTKVSR